MRENIQQWLIEVKSLELKLQCLHTQAAHILHMPKSSGKMTALLIYMENVIKSTDDTICIANKLAKEMNEEDMRCLANNLTNSAADLEILKKSFELVITKILEFDYNKPSKKGGGTYDVLS